MGTDRNGAPGRIEPLAYWFVVSCSTQREIPIESGSPRAAAFLWLRSVSVGRLMSRRRTVRRRRFGWRLLRQHHRSVAHDNHERLRRVGIEGPAQRHLLADSRRRSNLIRKLLGSSRRQFLVGSL